MATIYQIAFEVKDDGVPAIIRIRRFLKRERSGPMVLIAFESKKKKFRPNFEKETAHFAAGAALPSFTTRQPILSGYASVPSVSTKR